MRNGERNKVVAEDLNAAEDQSTISNAKDNKILATERGRWAGNNKKKKQVPFFEDFWSLLLLLPLRKIKGQWKTFNFWMSFCPTFVNSLAVNWGIKTDEKVPKKLALYFWRAKTVKRSRMK